jgi:acyl-CoA synthetase (AMP-forming)/AMP-acid ligase II
VPLNYRLTGAELENLAGQITPSQLITDPDRVDGLADLSGLEVIGRDEYLAHARSEASDSLEREWSMDPDEIAILLFTSGTTGPPKAAVIRHKHLVSYILTSVEFMSADENDAALVCVPPYHIAGVAAIVSSVYSGRRIVQLPNFSAEEWLELARKEQITNAFVVPTMLARIVEVLEGAGSVDLPHLRALSYGGGKMPQSVIERALELLPDTNFANAYGLTETSSTLSILGPDDHRAALTSDDPKVRRRLVSVGQPLPAIEVEIRNQDGQALGPNERGEIYVRGEQVSG